MKECYRISTDPLACEENQIRGKQYRITLLTECLVRLEYDEAGQFEDGATQMVLNRNFPPVPHMLSRTADGIIVRTARMEIQYNEKAFSPNGLEITLHGGKVACSGDWHFGDTLQDLHGTARTLDNVDGGNVALDHGVISMQGFSVLDDSKGLVLQPDGWLHPRKNGIQDLYFFGYGRDYLQALQDFYRLCGRTPMLPRYALGNWWSRFYKYTQQEYLKLMDQFAEKEIPLSVAVIDMDWHLTKIDPKYGGGWTGFTWNDALFPDHQAFLKELHHRGLHTTLNLHPADGIRAYEKAYPQLAAHMNVDQAQEEPVRFDPTDPEFLQHYYEDVLNPMEAEGVDFWWVDWQQGTHTKVENLDSLWVLNHYGYLDNAKNGKRALSLSRYAGPGSHRYPLGFSGDSIISWDSLRFQPYFTSTASNIGYSWWSHDIGGHMLGSKDDELTARWVQFGAFSPIMRLHSGFSAFNSKEPWRFRPEAEYAMTQALRLRHQMLPYLYTMNHRCYSENIPLVFPLYYQHPNDVWAYEHKNEYYFGSELLVLPVTSPRIKDLHVAAETVYLPDGLWYDFFSHRAYRGGRELKVYRPLETIPVFAKAGAIIPLTDELDATANPAQLHIHAYLGDSGSFTLYEDDGETQDYQNNICATTRMELDQCAFHIHAAEGKKSLLPTVRTYVLELIGCAAEASEIQVLVNGIRWQATVSKTAQGPTVKLHIDVVPTNAELTVVFGEKNAQPHNETLANIFDFLNQAEISFALKTRIYRAVESRTNLAMLLSELCAMELDVDLYNALVELICALD